MVARFTFEDKTAPVTKAVGDRVAFRLDIVNSYDGSKPASIVVGGLVLRCLNGMTSFKNAINLKYRHSGNIAEIALPDPKVIQMTFDSSIEKWRAMSDMKITRSLKWEIAENATKLQIVSPKLLETNLTALEGSETVWDLYNVYTNIITHQTPRIRAETSRTYRNERLNCVFNAFAFESESDLKLMPTISENSVEHTPAVVE